MVENSKDKRVFRRYGRKSVITVRTASGDAVQARLLDYSMIGVGVMMDSDEGFKTGDLVGIDVDDLGIHEPGRIEWVQRLPAAVKVGISRAGPIKGLLNNYRLADILMGLQRSLLTGTLEFRHNSSHKKIFISKGDIIYSRSDHREDQLGFFLYKEGTITREQFSESADIRRQTGKKQSRVLVELGYLKPTDLVSAFKRRAEYIIEGLFSVRDAEFEFLSGPLPNEEIIPIGLSAANIIYRGIKRTADRKDMKKMFAHDRIIDFSTNPVSLFQDIRLDDADKAMLSYVNGRSTIGELLKLSPASEEEALKGIYALLETKIIVIKLEGEAPHDISPEEVLEERDDDVVAEELVREIEKAYDEYIELGYYGILGVKDTATQQEIKRAYYRAAKKYHPDRHFRLSEELKDKLHDIFTFVAEAQVTLSNSESRNHYDRSLKQKPERMISSLERAAIKFMDGRAAFESKEFGDATQFFAEATYLDDSVAEYHYFYGLSLARLLRHKEAERALSRALRVEPENASVLAELGHVFIKLGFPKRARGNFEKATAIKPASRRARQGLEVLDIMAQEEGNG